MISESVKVGDPGTLTGKCVGAPASCQTRREDTTGRGRRKKKKKKNHNRNIDCWRGRALQAICLWKRKKRICSVLPWKFIILPSLSVCTVSPLQYSDVTADLLFSVLAHLCGLKVASSVLFKGIDQEDTRLKFTDIKWRNTFLKKHGLHECNYLSIWKNIKNNCVITAKTLSRKKKKLKKKKRKMKRKSKRIMALGPRWLGF